MSAAETPETPALTRIGRFYITSELGRGSIGCVYLGHDPVVGRDVALKTFNPRLTCGERNQHAHSLINEARAAGRLAHPHIVTIYDASSEGSTPYIAMEYMRGKVLQAILDGGHRYKPDDIAGIGSKLADALAHAHANQVIHRDIKPSNIFIVDGEHPKLMDFGIARAPNRIDGGQDDAGAPYTMFHANSPLGTPYYMSPEQAQGKPADERSDIYSLGTVLYQMLVGRKPFETEDTHQLLQQIAFKAPPAPHELDPSVPALLSQIVMKAMSKKPGKRYQDAKKMASDLRRFSLQERRARRETTAIPIPALVTSHGPVNAVIEASGARQTVTRTRLIAAAYVAAAIIGTITLIAALDTLR